MRGVLVWLGAAALLAGVAGAAALTLWACALNLPPVLGWAANCPPPQQEARAARLSALDREQRDLVRRIAMAEADLAGLQCTALPPDPNRPLDPRDWQDGDVAALYGCWNLSTDYRTRNVEHGEEVGYPAWQICFDTTGQGLQVMRDSDGIACQGPVAGHFSAPGTLRISEADDLPCGDGGFIYRREFSCTLAEGAVARCSTTQPDADGAGDMAVELRRAARPL